jgi:hypothetical protein
VDLFGDGLNVKLFADDVKIYCSIRNISDIDRFQTGLDALNAWSMLWQLPISIRKCSVLHLGRKNIPHTYSINGINLPDVSDITDLGITVDSSLRFGKHYRLIASKAHHRAALILKTFMSRNPVLLFRAFTVYVRPLVEYCSPVWAPIYKTDIALIERVQRRFTKRLYGFKKLSYRDRLFRLNNADTLELRRLKHDLLMIFKIVHKLVCINFDEFFGLNNSNCTRGHDFKLSKPFCANNARQFSFACRRIDIWNSLPTYAVSCNSIASFKHCLDKINFAKFLTVET